MGGKDGERGDKNKKCREVGGEVKKIEEGMEGCGREGGRESERRKE